MGEVFHAMQHLNRTLKLGLSGAQIAAAEASFKARLIPGDEKHIAENYEFVGGLRPRAHRLTTEQIHEFAEKEVRKQAE